MRRFLIEPCGPSSEEEEEEGEEIPHWMHFALLF